MPANRTVASLSIALIVFVMLTFVLAITTYLFFKQRLDEQQKAEAAAAETSKARTELNAARDEKRKLQEMLGAPEDKSIDQIEAETNARFAGEFAAFDAEPKTYLRLVEWLGAALRKKDTQMDAQRADHEKAISEKEQAIKKEQDDAKLAMEQKETADKDKQSEKDAFDAARKQFEQQQARLTEGERKALDQSTKYDKLRAEVAKGVQYLTPDRQKDFQSKQDPEAQLDVLYAVLRGQAKEIEGKNELLAKLRVADAAVQAAVDAAIPKDDRVDGFDGRVVSVDEAERTARKGLLEVIAVESPTVARARIRRDSIRNPILGGDGVATSLWAPGETPEVVVVGYVQLDTDAEADLESLRAAVERAGGRLVDGVTPATAIVVDAGLPKVAGGGKAAGWKQTDERRREREIKAARGLGVRVVGIDEMLDLLGMERAELEGGRLPMRGDDGRSLPRRSAGVAY
jgi:hypothetical protein